MKTEILELWDRTKHDIGSYKSEWREMLNAAYDAYDAAAYDAADVAVFDAAYDVAVRALALAHAARTADAHAALDEALFAADLWFKRAEEKMDALRETGETK